MKDGKKVMKTDKKEAKDIKVLRKELKKSVKEAKRALRWLEKHVLPATCHPLCPNPVYPPKAKQGTKKSNTKKKK